MIARLLIAVLLGLGTPGAPAPAAEAPAAMAAHGSHQHHGSPEEPDERSTSAGHQCPGCIPPSSLVPPVFGTATLTADSAPLAFVPAGLRLPQPPPATPPPRT